MKAMYLYDTNDRVYFVRLIAYDGSFQAVCSCPSRAEADLVARCLNAVASTDADRCMRASRALYEHMGIRLGNPLADTPADIHA